VLEKERSVHAASGLTQPRQQFAPSTSSITNKNRYWGLSVASLIIATWAASLVSLLRLEVQHLQITWLTLAILWQTFLYTGLFITAHDAMHGCIVPQRPRLNHAIGFLVLLCYGFLPYYKLRTAHWQHHQHPASDRDPDFHDGKHTHMLLWYARFMYRYWGFWQCIGITGAYHFIHRVLHVPEANLLLFWAVPSLLSSFQLFYFGTFLVHREPTDGYQNASRATSNYRPLVWSFLTCYHFGYHQEHHEQPNLPWWQLPAIALTQFGK
jgi:beta-carotene ketolase (CrtW type)